MITINPLIPHIPALLSYLIYGWIMGAVLRFAKRGGNGCIVAVILWYVIFLASVFLFGLLSVTSSENQMSFALGFLFPFTRTLWESTAVQLPISIFRDIFGFFRHLFWSAQSGWRWLIERRARGKEDTEETATRRRDEAQPGRDRQSRTTHEEAMRQEQTRREAEARSRREQAEQARQEQKSQEEECSRQEHKKTEPPKSRPKNRDSRSPEEVLGLKAPWTPEDLKTAYRREAGRTHPDKWIGKPEPIRQAMEEEYKAIQEAYRKLKG